MLNLKLQIPFLVIILIVSTLLTPMFNQVLAIDPTIESTTTPDISPTPEPYKDPTGGEKGTEFFFSQEVLNNSTPLEFQNKIPQGSGAQFEMDAAKHMQSLNLPLEVIEKTVTEVKPKPTQNLYDAIFSWLKKFFVPLTTGPSGFAQSYLPTTQTFSGQKVVVQKDTTPETFDQAATYVEKTLYPAEFGPDYFTASLGKSAININSAKLRELFKKTADDQCVPLGILQSISHREFGGVSNYSDEEVEKYSKNDWQTNSSPLDLIKTSCLNTCDSTSGACAQGDDVRGPLQFELKTWNGHIEQIKHVLEKKYGIPHGTYIPNRCNIRDAIIGAAIKIKAASNSGENCKNWSQETVYKIAENYCGAGACQNHPACGVNYCKDVWKMYSSFKTSETM